VHIEIGHVPGTSRGCARSRAYAAQGDLAYAPVTEWLRTEALRTRLPKLSHIWLTEICRLLQDPPEEICVAPEGAFCCQGGISIPLLEKALAL
jgi:hypothetical protein